jgi:hypothetical protein
MTVENGSGAGSTRERTRARESSKARRGGAVCSRGELSPFIGAREAVAGW